MLRKTLSLLRTYPKAIATNKHHDFLENVTNYFDLTRFFDVIQGYMPGEMEAKPAPDMIHTVVKKMGYTGKTIVYVGDTESDILAGNSAGAITVAVTYGIGDNDLMMKHKPDYVINHFSELEKIVKQL